MLNERLYEIWAPAGGLWSPWAKPVLFLDLSPAMSAPARPASEFQRDVSWAPAPGDSGIVIDLPGDDSTILGVALAHRGFRPVPLYNCCTGPLAVLDAGSIIRALVAGAEVLDRLNLPFNAPPAFLLDSRRTDVAKRSITPGMFDNRWITLPQDFPSANFLLSNGIRRILLIHDRAGQPRDDLAHVLLRWQEAGIAIDGVSHGGVPQPLPVNRPSMFRGMLYVALALMGLRRNSAGGFGSIVPQPSSRGAGYG